MQYFLFPSQENFFLRSLLSFTYTKRQQTDQHMKCLLLLALVTCVYAAAFYNIGKCPEYRKPGDRWSPPNTCMECYCDEGGYGCMGCGLVATSSDCNIVVNYTLKHPDCCPRLECPTLGR